jgi:hypothetical protein
MDLQSRREPISHIPMENQFLWIEWPEGDSHEWKPCEMNALFANSRNFSTGPVVLDPPSTSNITV